MIRTQLDNYLPSLLLFVGFFGLFAMMQFQPDISGKTVPRSRHAPVPPEMSVENVAPLTDSLRVF